eukprot:snap_masked-scaffold_50-processed-gene-0.17-mRNA-1 protein AED:1.00 eAED:1.00 QI:0/0/0/0/1/1/2/0/684
MKEKHNSTDVFVSAATYTDKPTEVLRFLFFPGDLETKIIFEEVFSEQEDKKKYLVYDLVVTAKSIGLILRENSRTKEVYLGGFSKKQFPVKDLGFVLPGDTIIKVFNESSTLEENLEIEKVKSFISTSNRPFIIRLLRISSKLTQFSSYLSIQEYSNKLHEYLKPVVEDPGLLSTPVSLMESYLNWKTEESVAVQNLPDTLKMFLFLLKVHTTENFSGDEDRLLLQRVFFSSSSRLSLLSSIQESKDLSVDEIFKHRKKLLVKLYEEKFSRFLNTEESKYSQTQWKLSDLYVNGFMTLWARKENLMILPSENLASYEEKPFYSFWIFDVFNLEKELKFFTLQISDLGKDENHEKVKPVLSATIVKLLRTTTGVCDLGNVCFQVVTSSSVLLVYFSSTHAFILASSSSSLMPFNSSIHTSFSILTKRLVDSGIDLIGENIANYSQVFDSKESIYKATSWDWMKMVNLSDLCKVIEALILEKKVLVVAPNFSLLTMVCCGLLKLLPLPYPHVVQTVLSKDDLYVLQSPSPFLLGVHEQYAFKKDFPFVVDLVVVDLSKGEITFPDAQVLLDSSSLVQNEVEDYGNYVSEQLSNPLRKAIFHNEYSLDLACSPKQGAPSSLKLAQNFWQPLLHELRTFSFSCPNRNQTYVDRKSLFEHYEQSSSKKAFLKSFVQTQMFLNFISANRD